MLCTGVELISLVMHILVSLLLDRTALSSASPYSLKLHDNAQQRLTKLGPLYAAQFRSVVVATPELKAHLEATVKAQQEQQQHTQQQKHSVISGNKHAAAHQANAPAKPSIKLKIDFSNFGARS